MRFELYPSMFGDRERLLCAFGEIAVSTFLFDSGVAGLRVKNTRGEIVMLPFQGQQIWRASFDGRDLTMRSMFDAPRPTQEYLETYGGFLIHCGLAGLGAPGPGDTHPLHGELPNAPFQSAWLEVEPDRVTVSGSYQHSVAFSTNYRAIIRTTLSASSSLLDVSVQVENLKRTSMDLMYLGHANFRPVDHGELHYTADYSPDTVRVRRSIPSHVTPKPGYAEFLEALAEDPTGHHVLRPNLAFDPEVVFEIDMKSDADGFAHAVQKHPDGTADYVRCRPDQARLCTRWICRTPDQDGLGLAFPATSGVEGYTVEKSKGRVETVAGGDSWRLDMQLGLLAVEETSDMIEKINRVRAA
ncbi:MAG: DUF4432 family protein [Pseudomonadota bacterium]